MNERLSGRRFSTVLAGLRRGVRRLIRRVAAVSPDAVADDALADDVRKLHRVTDDLQRMLESHDFLDRLARGSMTVDDISKMRHDLRAQIGAIMGYAEMILEEIGPGPGPAADLGAIVEAADQLLPVVQGLDYEQLTDSADSGEVLLVGATEVVYEETYRGRTVLVVDDSADRRDLLVRQLDRAGLEVLSAADGPTGLTTAAREPVDLILCDVMMPGMSGFDVLGQLKSIEATRDIPVLMISALDEVGSIVRCLEAGAEDYLATPFNPTILHARIKASLDRAILRGRDRERIRQLAEARQELETAIESIDDAFAILDAELRLRRHNRRFATLYPAVADLGPATTYRDLLRANWRREVYFSERRHGSRPAEPVDFEDWAGLRLARLEAATPHVERLQDGRWIEIVPSRMPEGGLVTLHKDVTHRVKEEERLRFLSSHDPLTGLANRARFETVLAEAIGGSARDGRPLALLFLDLDGFKGVNDTFGHAAGDELLSAIGSRLGQAVREGDLVARLGGDEFAILVRGDPGPDAVRALAERVSTRIGERFESDGTSVPLGVSIGVAFHPSGGATGEDLLAAADLAMYAAKKAGGGLRFHAPGREPGA